MFILPPLQRGGGGGGFEAVADEFASSRTPLYPPSERGDVFLISPVAYLAVNSTVSGLEGSHEAAPRAIHGKADDVGGRSHGREEASVDCPLGHTLEVKQPSVFLTFCPGHRRLN